MSPWRIFPKILLKILREEQWVKAQLELQPASWCMASPECKPPPEPWESSISCWLLCIGTKTMGIEAHWMKEVWCATCYVDEVLLCNPSLQSKGSDFVLPPIVIARVLIAGLIPLLGFTINPTSNFPEHMFLSEVLRPLSSSSRTRRLKPTWDLSQLSDAPL